MLSKNLGAAIKEINYYLISNGKWECIGKKQHILHQFA